MLHSALKTVVSWQHLQLYSDTMLPMHVCWKTAAAVLPGLHKPRPQHGQHDRC